MLRIFLLFEVELDLLLPHFFMFFFLFFFDDFCRVFQVLKHPLNGGRFGKDVNVDLFLELLPVVVEVEVFPPNLVLPLFLGIDEHLESFGKRIDEDSDFGIDDLVFVFGGVFDLLSLLHFVQVGSVFLLFDDVQLYLLDEVGGEQVHPPNEGWVRDWEIWLKSLLKRLIFSLIRLWTSVIAFPSSFFHLSFAHRMMLMN